jgi:hypothetical protein
MNVPRSVLLPWESGWEITLGFGVGEADSLDVGDGLSTT